jgi:hypothetical protein
MWLVTRLAGFIPGMFLRNNLRHPFRTCGNGLMTARAELRRIGQDRFVGGGILCVLKLRAVTSLARDRRVFGSLQHLECFIVTGGARVTAGVGEGSGARVRQSARAVVPELPEPFGDDGLPREGEDGYSRDENRGEPD